METIMNAMGRPARVLAEVGAFKFYEIVEATDLDLVGDSADALALFTNYRQNIARLKKLDMPDEAKIDIMLLAEQAMVERFVEWGVPKHLAWHLWALGHSCGDDRNPATFTRGEG